MSCGGGRPHGDNESSMGIDSPSHGIQPVSLHDGINSTLLVSECGLVSSGGLGVGCQFPAMLSSM